MMGNLAPSDTQLLFLPADREEYMVACCDEFAKHFIAKVAHFRHDLDFTLGVCIDVPLSVLLSGILSSV